MSKEGEKYIDEEVIGRFLAREATSEEMDQVLSWAKISVDNQRTLDQIKVVWVDTGKVKLEDGENLDINIEAALSRVRERKDQLIKSDSSSFFGLFFKVAAVVVVAAGIGWFAWDSQVKQLEYFATSSILNPTLADGTKVSLNQGSTLSTPEKFGDQREVILSGEAFFDVISNPDKPFIIKTQKTQIEVLGTSFNVNEEVDGNTLVSVAEGKVKFSSEGESILLNRGMTGIYNSKSGELSISESSNTGEYQFWRTRRLAFRGLALNDVVMTLNRTYKVQIELANEKVGNCQLSVIFEDEKIDDILEIISITLGLEITNLGTTIILDGEGC